MHRWLRFLWRVSHRRTSTVPKWHGWVSLDRDSVGFRFV